MNQQRPNNYLIPAIISIIFCCIPGIVSIVFSTQVNSKFEAGDYAGAQKASNNAKTWMIIAFVLGAISLILSLLIPSLAIGSLLQMS